MNTLSEPPSYIPTRHGAVLMLAQHPVFRLPTFFGNAALEPSRCALSCPAA